MGIPPLTFEATIWPSCDTGAQFSLIVKVPGDNSASLSRVKILYQALLRR